MKKSTSLRYEEPLNTSVKQLLRITLHPLSASPPEERAELQHQEICAFAQGLQVSYPMEKFRIPFWLFSGACSILRSRSTHSSVTTDTPISLGRSLCLSISPYLSLSLSLSHTHKHTLSISLSHSLSISLPPSRVQLSLSVSRPLSHPASIPRRG